MFIASLWSKKNIGYDGASGRCKLLKFFFVGWAIWRCLSTTPHPMIRARGSILLVLYSMIILEPAIFYIMVVVRYNHTLVYNSPSCKLLKLLISTWLMYFGFVSYETIFSFCICRESIQVKIWEQKLSYFISSKLMLAYLLHASCSAWKMCLSLCRDNSWTVFLGSFSCDLFCHFRMIND